MAVIPTVDRISKGQGWGKPEEEEKHVGSLSAVDGGLFWSGTDTNH